MVQPKVVMPCKYGNDYHTKECRSRFNTLLEGEPIKAPKTPVVGVPKTPSWVSRAKGWWRAKFFSGRGGWMMTMNLRLLVMLVRLRMLWVLLASQKGLKFQLNPNFWREVPMLRHQSWLKLSKMVRMKPWCHADLLRYRGGSARVWEVKAANKQGMVCWVLLLIRKFLLSKVCQQLEVPYLGLSVDFGDLLDDGVFAQVEYWFHEKVQENENHSFVFGSIPCGPFSPIQNLNLATKGESFKKYLKKERKKSLELVSRFPEVRPHCCCIRRYCFIWVAKELCRVERTIGVVFHHRV